ncbi:MAG: ATP-dependent RNA helicase HrpA [Acidimicrobiia bacterium]
MAPTPPHRAAPPRRFSYPDDLPISGRRPDLINAIRDHQVVIVSGETGSGKSTQLPKLCLEAGRGLVGMIGHTQPRRIAARSIAERVAEELGTRVGGLVGYAVRFTDRVGEDTVVKVMTDGILLAEIHRDRRMARYDTIIVDEAHERSLNIDFLLGYLAELLPQRPDLKVIVTSATIDTDRFSRFFGGAPVMEVSGRTHPVEIRYRPLDDPVLAEPRDQPQAICDAVVELLHEGPGDILVFCSGEREIRDAADALTDLELRNTEILPLYGRLSAAEQHRVFEPHRGRRIVLATNVAETSLTVPGIRYVVDPGAARISRYNRRTKVQRLPIEPISRASADQRAGRCGRLGPGICIRLYSEEDHAGRPAFTEPEIQRTNLAAVILQMAALRLGEIESFPFIDAPDRRSIRDGVALLEELGAVDLTRAGTGHWLTSLGRRLARFPIDVRLGRMILEADRHACVREVTIIASALSIQDPRVRPAEGRERADELHRRFAEPGSDLLGWLRLWEHLESQRRARSSNQFRRMCREELLDYRRVREWQDVNAQIRRLVGELGLHWNTEPADPDAVHRSVLSGLLSQVGVKDPVGWEYRGARGARFSIAPGSALFKQSPEWVMAAELVETNRLWARQVARIRAEWIEEAAAHLVRRSSSDPWWDAERGMAVAHETVTMYGIPLVTDRTVIYGRIDPDGARRLFIRHALVAGEWDTRHRFARLNQDRIHEVAALEERTRRPGLLVDDEAIADVFDARLPAGIVSARHFDRWWRDARDEDPHRLDLAIDDLVDPAVGLPDPTAFPDTWRHGALELPLVYELAPGSPDDGLTVIVPVWGLDRIDPAAFDWLVPGMRPELITTLIRSLPKPVRKVLVPIPDTVRSLLDRLDPGRGGLAEVLRTEVSRLSGIPLAADAIDLAVLPGHLRPRFRVVGEDGEALAEGDDLDALRGAVGEQAARSTGHRHELEIDGLTAWSIGELPRVVEIGEPGRRVPAYPALVDESDSVAVRLLPTRDAQAEAMWGGTRRLLALGLASPGRLLAPVMTEQTRLAVRAGPYPDTATWAADCLDAALDDLIAEAGGPAWDALAFDRLRWAVQGLVGDRVDEIAGVSLEIHELLGSIWERVDRLDGEAFAASVADVEEQLSRLVYPGFVAGVGRRRLADVRRYLGAIERRLDRLPDDISRDRELMERVRSLEAEVDRLREALPASDEPIEAAWMCQELRVSLFAQTLGTRSSVSEQRIRRLLAGALGG